MSLDRKRRKLAETPAAQPLAEQLLRIRKLEIGDLRTLWRSMTHESARKALSRDLLARAIAYRVQEETLVKLGRDTRKLLDRLARGESEPVRHLKIGSILVREHQGTVHQVMVVPGGFSWQEKTYASLSTIARVITGTSWNRPRFFGLRGNSSQDVAVTPAIVEAGQARASSRSAVRAREKSFRTVEPRL